MHCTVSIIQIDIGDDDYNDKDYDKDSDEKGIYDVNKDDEVIIVCGVRPTVQWRFYNDDAKD